MTVEIEPVQAGTRPGYDTLTCLRRPGGERCAIVQGRNWNSTSSTVEIPRYGLRVTDFTMVRAAGAYQCEPTDSPITCPPTFDIPRKLAFDSILNASNSPARTRTLSWPTTVTSMMDRPFAPVSLVVQSVVKLHRLPTSSGKLSSFGFDSFCRGDSTTFRSGVRTRRSPFSVPSIHLEVMESITQVRFGFVTGTP